MVDSTKTNLDSVRVGTAGIDIEILSEPDVVLTFRGYAPILNVKVLKSGLTKILYISAKSLSNELEQHRQGNGGKFTGLKLFLQKESSDKFAQYIVERKK